jgi:anaerobic dimethyl sulfoxide reductase subunit A
MTGNIGVLGGCAEGVGKAWHAEAVAYPYDEYANIWFASIKSDRWAHMRAELPQRDPRGNRGCGRATISSTGWSQHQGDLLAGIRLVQPAHQHQQGNPGDPRSWNLVVCMDSTITPSGLYADVLFPVATHFERHDAALPWYKGHYYIHRPKVIEPMGNPRPTSRSSPNWPTASATRPGAATISARATTRRPTRDYFLNDDAVDEAYLREWWEGKVMAHQGMWP